MKTKAQNAIYLESASTDSAHNGKDSIISSKYISFLGKKISNEGYVGYLKHAAKSTDYLEAKFVCIPNATEASFEGGVINAEVVFVHQSIAAEASKYIANVVPLPANQGNPWTSADCSKYYLDRAHPYYELSQLTRNSDKHNIQTNIQTNPCVKNPSYCFFRHDTNFEYTIPQQKNSVRNPDLDDVAKQDMIQQNLCVNNPAACYYKKNPDVQKNLETIPEENEFAPKPNMSTDDPGQYV